MRSLPAHMTDDRPNLLFLCQTLPFPPDGGVNIRTYNVLKLLAQRYRIHALCFYRRGIAASLERSLSGLRPLVESVETFPIAQEQSQQRFVSDHLKSTVSRTVYTRHVYEHAGVRQRIRTLLAERRYALAHVDSLDLATYLPELGDLPVVCVHHNVESMLLGRRALVEDSLIKRRYLQFQSGLMRREEALWAPRVALNVVCSPDDQAALQEIAPGARVTVVPNGVDVHTFQPPDPAVAASAQGVVFVGGITWFPNKDGMAWFAEAILPELAAIGHRPTVTWVGRALPDTASIYAAKGVTITGYVDDVRPFVHNAACYIVPLRVGGGTRLKVLDAWALGQALVSTTVGCEGLDARDGWNILIRDEPKAFAAAIAQLLGDPALRSTLGQNARATAVDTYSWEGIGTGMLAAYRAIEAHPAATASS